jgi:hypothetical protein
MAMECCIAFLLTQRLLNLSRHTAYNASTKHHLPQPTKIDPSSQIVHTNQAPYFNPYMNEGKDEYDKKRKVSYVPMYLADPLWPTIASHWD